MKEKIDTMKEVEQEVLEQDLIEKKLSKARKAEKTPVEKKKGQSVNFIPASRLPKIEAPEGYRVAWKHNTPENIRRLQIEGWEIANRIEHNMDMNMGQYYRKMNDKPASEGESTIQHNELIAMLITDELADARKEYYRQETEKQTRTKLQPEKTASAFIRESAKLTTTMEIN